MPRTSSTPTSRTPKTGDDVESAAQFIDEKIKQLGDWRGETLARIRHNIKQADPDIVE